MTSTLPRGLTAAPDPSATAQVEIVVPVHNEERSLALSIRRLHRFLRNEFPLSWRIVIADNASTDVTPGIAAALARELDHVSWIRLERKGRGRALRAAWSTSQAQVVCYMDVDLSTDLRALLPLVAPLLSGHSDVAIGTRLSPGSQEPLTVLQVPLLASAGSRPRPEEQSNGRSSAGAKPATHHRDSRRGGPGLSGDRDPGQRRVRRRREPE